MLSGRVTRTQSGFFVVETLDGLVTSQISGKLKIDAQRAETRDGMQRSDLVALNDFVKLERNDDGTGTIIEVQERHHVLSRVAPGGTVGTAAESEQIILANTDQVIFIVSANKPSPRLRSLDRLLVIAEKAEIPSIVICVNKIDLVQREKIEALFRIYENIGYRVLYVSALTGNNIEMLKNLVTGNKEIVSVFTGASGVGKSSLLNTLQEGLRLQTKDVSASTSKGRHTTRFSQLIRFDGGGYVADTPGIRSIAPWDIEPHELDNYYIEMRSYIEQCKFADCSHVHEPGCAVLQAIKDGNIEQERYESYLRLREELEEQYVY
jgi:ribosome biogenesis GTPase